MNGKIYLQKRKGEIIEKNNYEVANIAYDIRSINYMDTNDSASREKGKDRNSLYFIG